MLRLTHLIYAIATLAGVSIIALNGPSQALDLAAPQTAMTGGCDADHLEQPCAYAARSHDVLDGGRVVAR